MPESLTDILERCRCGDQKACGIVVSRFHSKALDFAMAFVRERNLAEDVVQEAFLEAFVRLEQLHDTAAFPGWFRQIVRSKALRVIRKRKNDTIEISLDHQLPSTTPVDPVELEEMKQTVRQAVEKLPKIGKETAKLFYLEELNEASIANKLGIPRGTVKSRLHTARNRLRYILADYWEDSQKK